MGTVHRTRKRWAIRDPLGRTHHNFPRRNPYRHKYHLFDRFDDAGGAYAAAAVRACTPGPGNLTFGGQSSVYTAQNSRLEYAGSASGAATFRGDAVSRVPGRMLIWKSTRTNSASLPHMGWWDSATITDTTKTANIFRVNSGVLGIREHIGSTPQGVDFTGENYSVDTEYEHAIVLRTAGAFHFHRGGNWGNTWQLVWIADGNTSATLYPAAWVNNSASATGNVDNVRVPKALWIPQPLGIPLNTVTTATADLIIDVDVTRGSGDGGTSNYWQCWFRYDGATSTLRLRVYDDGSAALVEVNGTPGSPILSMPAGSLAKNTRSVLRVMAYGGTYRMFRHVVGAATWTVTGGTPDPAVVTGKTFNITTPGILLSSGGNPNPNLPLNGINVWPRAWSDFPNV